MIKPNVLVISGYGINCEEETQFAFELAGAHADIVHINDLIDKQKKLSDYQIIAFPGGFAYGDDTGAGNAFANKMRNHLWDEFMAFIQRDTLTIGICNGFQILASLGVFTTNKKSYGKRYIALLPNDTARYTVRWVDMEATGKSQFFAHMDTFSLPIAHGEGRFFTTGKMLKEFSNNLLIDAKYIKGEICEFQSISPNPNGSMENIAAITDATGRIMGMMPHPERAILFTQLPHWTYLKQLYKKQDRDIPTYGPGLKIFQNTIEYFS